MRNNREENHNNYNHRDFDDRNNNNRNDNFYGRQESYRRDITSEPDRYRPQRELGYDIIGGDGDVSHNPNRYKAMYDTANYSDEPRSFDYGLPHGAESSNLDRVERFPDDYEPRNYRYSEGYNPNYDNPEEGDRYRNFDSRGNHGFRHDAAYGNQDEFRDFGNDHYGRRDRTNNDRNYGYMGGYNR